MRVFLIISLIICYLIYLDKKDMLLTSYLMSRVTSVLIPIILPLDKGWDEKNIQIVRKTMEPVNYKPNFNHTYINIPLEKNDHRHKQEMYLKNESRALYRIYIPHQIKELKKVILWYHGGGFMIGNIRSDHEICEKISNLTDSVVVNVNYGLSPENKFPIAITDSINAVNWVNNNIHIYGGNKNNIYLIGESAGGNLVLSIIPYLKTINIKGIVSIYPPLNIFSYTNSHWKYANLNGFLTLNHMIKISSYYISHFKEAEDPRVNPLLLNNKSLNNYPNTLFILAKYDILYEDGLLFADKLKNNNKSVEVKIYSDVHGFFGRFGYGDEALEDMVTFLLNN